MHLLFRDKSAMKNKRSFRRRSKNTTYINVAPFVDVMLVLMMIFMLTSQISTVGVQVELPKTTAQNANDKDSPIIISIDKDAKIFIEEACVSLDELLRKLPAIMQNGKNDIVYIRGDKRLNYGTLMEIMGAISSSGVCKVSLIAEAQNKK